MTDAVFDFKAIAKAMRRGPPEVAAEVSSAICHACANLGWRLSIQYGGFLSKMFSVRCWSDANRSPRLIERRLEPPGSRCAVSV
jgi:hypothetical protein